MNSLLYTVIQKSTHSFWYLSFLMYWRTWKVCNYFRPPCRYVVFGLCLWLNASQRYYDISMHWCLSATYQVLYLSMITGISQTTLEPSSSTHSHLTTSFSSIADMYRLQRIIGVLGATSSVSDRWIKAGFAVCDERHDFSHVSSRADQVVARWKRSSSMNNDLDVVIAYRTKLHQLRPMFYVSQAARC